MSYRQKADSTWPLIPPLYRTIGYSYVACKLGFDNSYDTMPKNHQHIDALMERLDAAEHICVFGMGDLFRSKYFIDSWNMLIKANIISDNALDNTCEYSGIPCIPPDRLVDYDNLLVISFIRNYQDVHRQLNEMGIENIMSIFEIVNILDDSEELYKS